MSAMPLFQFKAYAGEDLITMPFSVNLDNLAEARLYACEAAPAILSANILPEGRNGRLAITDADNHVLYEFPLLPNSTRKDHSHG